jgi:hypothetical protein
LLHLRKLVGYIAGAVTALSFLGPVAAEILKRWLDRNGYLDHPEQGLAWLLSVLASSTEQPWFYPIVAALAGLTAGLWLEEVLRRWDGERAQEMHKLGLRLTALAHGVRGGQGGFRSVWPDNVSHMRGSLSAIFSTLKSWRIAAPSDHIFEMKDGAEIMVQYLEHVSAYLISRDLRGARQKAKERLKAVQS